MKLKTHRKAIVIVLLLLLAATVIHDQSTRDDDGQRAFAAVTTAPNYGGAVVTPTPAPGYGNDPPQAMQAHAQGIFFDPQAMPAHSRQPAQPSPPDIGQLQRVDIVDQTGFGRPLPMFSMELPRGWQHQHRVDWDKSTYCPFNGPRVVVNADSPDGLYGITILPGMGWQVSSRTVAANFACPPAGMNMPRDYLEQIAGQLRPGMRVLSFRERPDLLNPAATIPEYGGELLIAYSVQGVDMRESLIATINHTTLSGGGLLAVASVTMAVRAPDGQLDFGFIQQVTGSLQPGEDWNRLFGEWSAGQIRAWHEGRMSAIAMAGEADRHRINMDTIAEVGRLNTETFNNRMASNERTNNAFIDTIREVQPWRDPGSGRQVDLPMHYSHAWQLSDGRHFLTNDSNFEPYRDLGIAGERMQQVR
ncbi:MAG: hypothetical protein WCZ02_02395 [Lysobacterales bacterium]